MTSAQKRTFATSALVVLVALLMAIPIGLQRKRIAELEAQLAGEDPPAAAAPSAIVSGPPARLVNSSSAALERVVGDLEKWEAEVSGFSVDEFGERLSGLLGDIKDPDNMTKAALMLRAIEPETAFATDKVFREQRGMGKWDDSQKLRGMLKALGEKSGRAGLDYFLADSPNGFSGLSSYMHGWTKSDQAASLAWVNALPEDSKLYGPALKGVFWSAGTSGPEFAAEAFNSLDLESMDPKLLNGVGNSMGGALMSSHGVEGVEIWVQSLPETMQTRAIGWALDRADGQPIGDVASWLGTHAGRSDDLARMFEWGVEEWSDSNPEAAMEWAVGEESLWQQPGLWNGISEGAGPGHMAAWVEEHPDHPAAESLREWLYPEEKEPAETE